MQSYQCGFCYEKVSAYYSTVCICCRCAWCGFITRLY